MGFAFSGASHWHRHAADKWARPAVTPYHFASVQKLPLSFPLSHSGLRAS
jgi:hypothetical protein